ncbi:MAG: PQQ-binding-like beta-propeller repeat protein [Planctomycetota bacterium]|nr:PQQ-binding-like beta-propeller repeat protein [Planctomycetota bacterium]
MAATRANSSQEKTLVRIGLLLICSFSLSRFSVQADDWLQWRGPNHNGIARSQESPPVKWDLETHVLWKSKVPGRGHSSPTLVKDYIFLSTADESSQVQSILCFDRRSGKPLWKKSIHQGKFAKPIHKKNTHASPTIASDGKAIYVVFNRDSSVFLSKLALDGQILWQINAGRFEPHYPFGFAASPTVFESSIIVSSESEKVGFIAAFDLKNGKEKWRTPRLNTTYSSPIVGKIAGKSQLLLSGNQAVTAFDPRRGTILWSTPALWQASCGTLVWSQDSVFASGGFPKSQTLCVKADGSGQVVWQNNVKCYEQSLLYHDGYLYAISDSGIGYCWNASNGKEMWKTRMEGPVSSSPILANGNIFYSSERGTTFVFKANPDQFELVSKNRVGDSAFATPAFCDDRIYIRVGIYEENRLQEYLVCIGKNQDGQQ